MDDLRNTYGKELHFVYDRLVIGPKTVGREITDWDTKVYLAKQVINRLKEDAHISIRYKLKAEGLTENQIRQALTEVHDAAIQEAQAEIKALEPQAALELERLVLLGSVPAFGPDLDKIIRYEASLDRQLYKAINQLERLQRRRKGEDLPAPVVLDET